MTVQWHCHLVSLNSINGILTVVTLSKNSIRIPYESKEQSKLKQILTVRYSTPQYNLVIARKTDKIHTLARLSISHNFGFSPYWTLPLPRSEWLDPPLVPLD